MKNTTKAEALRRSYFHRLLSDRSVEDKMPVFVEAKKIFDLLKQKSRNSRKN